MRLHWIAISGVTSSIAVEDVSSHVAICIGFNGSLGRRRFGSGDDKGAYLKCVSGSLLAAIFQLCMFRAFIWGHCFHSVFALTLCALCTPKPNFVVSSISVDLCAKRRFCPLCVKT